MIPKFSSPFYSAGSYSSTPYMWWSLESLKIHVF